MSTITYCSRIFEAWHVGKGITDRNFMGILLLDNGTYKLAYYMMGVAVPVERVFTSLEKAQFEFSLAYFVRYKKPYTPSPRAIC